jgi:hypothetical protein
LLFLPVLMVGASLALHAAAPAPGEQTSPAAPPKLRPPAVNNSQRVVALIYDDIPITREELGEFLIARYGAERLEQLVNRRIIEHMCAKQGITVTEQEIESGWKEELARLNITEKEFTEKMLKAHGKSLFEWKEDVIRPSLLMGKLCRQKITASEDDLRKMFEHLYGKKVRCKWMVWPKEQGDAARRGYEETRRRLEAPDAKGLEVTLVGRPIGDEMSDLAEEAFKLKPGEVSPLRTARDGSFFVIQCVGFVAAVEGKTFAEERPRLMKEVIDHKIAAEMPRLFKAYREEARPRILLRPHNEMTGQKENTTSSRSPR